AAAEPARHAVDLDGAVLRAQVAAVRGRGRVRALRGRLRRAARRGAGGGAADRGRLRGARDRHGDGADTDPGARCLGDAGVRLPARGRRMSDDVAIAGLGIHPFGRHEGVSALEMAALAARRALADAGLRWEEIDFAAGGSDAGGNADTSVSALGLTGLPFI